MPPLWHNTQIHSSSNYQHLQMAPIFLGPYHCRLPDNINAMQRKNIRPPRKVTFLRGDIVNVSGKQKSQKVVRCPLGAHWLAAFRKSLCMMWIPICSSSATQLFDQLADFDLKMHSGEKSKQIRPIGPTFANWWILIAVRQIANTVATSSSSSSSTS